MSIAIYTISKEKIVHDTSVDFSSRSVLNDPVHLVQYDNSIPLLAITLKNNHQLYTLIDSMSVWMRWKKPDGTFIRKQALGCNTYKNVVYFDVTQQMVFFPGTYKPIIELTISSDNSENEVAASSCFTIVVDKNPVQNNDIESTTIYEDPYRKVTYSKTEVDNKLSSKENIVNKINDKTQITNETINYPSLKYLNEYYYDASELYEKSEIKELFGLNLSVVFDEYGVPLNYTDGNTISAGSFATGNKNIKFALISKNVNRLYSGVFANCNNLTDVYIEGSASSITIDSGAIPSTVSIHYNYDFNNNKNIITSLKYINSQLNNKYDSSNIESGNGVLTVYTPAAVEANLVKSSTFRYQKTGNTANIFFSVVFNEGSIGYLQFTGLPFISKNESDQNRHLTATNKQTQAIVYPVGSWLTLNFGGTKTFTQDETLNGVITILVN